MPKLPRGIAPETLLSQIRSTMPYLFDGGGDEGRRLEEQLHPARIVRELDRCLPETLSHFEYFRLCLSAHALTVATPVPTDVDNQIRQKLWPASLPLEIALAMARLVLESRDWDYALLTNRFAYGAAGTPWEKEILHGHYGEWFTVACGAYCALGQYGDATEARKLREALLDAIAREVERHSEVFGSLWRGGDGIGALKASAAVAHNCGDLDRVMDMWKLDVADPLRLRHYKLAITPYDPDTKLRHMGRLWVAGELYKSVISGSSMALENHRHYALRKARSLRLKGAFRIATGPFFDDWGKAVAHGLASPDGDPTPDTREVFDILKAGWDRQPRSLGYGRALRAMIERHADLDAGGFERAPELRQMLKISQKTFEATWNDKALEIMDDIPSRA
jgi:hypothetical protein